MRILLGIDDSKNIEFISKAFISQFHPEDTRIRVIHVVQPIGLAAVPQMSQGYAPELSEQMKRAKDLVEQVAKELQAAKFQIEITVEIGDIREGIIDAAEAWHADLIVVGSHGRSGIQRFLLGSVAESVARHAKCSVEIIRRPMGD
jgi:nucleotide-binding universal stress UspA family protein